MNLDSKQEGIKNKALRRYTCIIKYMYSSSLIRRRAIGVAITLVFWFVWHFYRPRRLNDKDKGESKAQPPKQHSKHATKEEKDGRVVDYVLCLQRDGRFLRISTEVLHMTMLEASAVCKQNNLERKKGQRLCVLPLSNPNIVDGLAGSVLTLSDVQKMADNSEGSYLNLRGKGICQEGIRVVLRWCQDSDPAHVFTSMGLTGNNIADKGVSSLISADRAGRMGLMGLFLSANNIGCAGASSLAQHMRDDKCNNNSNNKCSSSASKQAASDGSSDVGEGLVVKHEYRSQVGFLSISSRVYLLYHANLKLLFLVLCCCFCCFLWQILLLVQSVS